MVGLIRRQVDPDNGVMSQPRSVQALLSALVTVALMMGCAPDLNWRSWRTDEIGVTQLFPCKPVRQQRQFQLHGRSLAMVLLVCDGAEVTWAQAHADAIDPSAVAPLIEDLLGAAHRNLGAARDVPLPLVVPGATPNMASGHYRLRGRAPDGRVIEEELLLFVKGTLVVQVTALGARLPNGSAEQFLSSVRVGS